MGTSGSYGGPGVGTSIVPTWLEPLGTGAPPAASPPDGDAPSDDAVPAVPAAPPDQPAMQPSQLMGSMSAARADFTRFAGSGGSDRRSLRRAVANYVSGSTGGARQAARRMGSSRNSSVRLLNFLTDVQARGAAEALRTLNLEGLAGQPIEEIFLGLVDYVVPEGGSVDEGIARDAFIETIADLASLGVGDLDALTADQMHTVFEMYATHAIEARIYNDIGTKGIKLPRDIAAVNRIQAQLHDFVRGGVSDALTAARAAFGALTTDRVLTFVADVYDRAFDVLQTLGEAAEAT